MQNLPDWGSTPRWSSWIMIIILSGYTLAGMFVFSFLSQFLTLPFFAFDYRLMSEAYAYPAAHPQARTPLLVAQGVASLGAFLLTPLFFVRRFMKMPVLPFFALPKPLAFPLVIMIAITLGFMVVNSVAIEWNQHVELPAFMSGFELQAKTKELQLRQLTDYLTNFQTASQLLLGLVVIAVIPAIGEEFLFRGLLQNLFHKAFGNAHAAIWFTALLFGAFHLQFYGALPRTLLGVLFGYVYYWSGSLFPAILGHFINNGFTLIMLYLNGQGVIDYDITENSALLDLSFLLLSAAVCGGLLFVFRNFYKKTTGTGG